MDELHDDVFDTLVAARGRINALQAAVSAQAEALTAAEAVILEQRVEIARLQRMVDGMGARIAGQSDQLSRLAEVKIVMPAGHDPANHCTFCGARISEDDANATLHITAGPVTLCDGCYKAAGNSVRRCGGLHD